MGNDAPMLQLVMAATTVKSDTFDFLWFTHICAKRKSDGSFTLRGKTFAKRLRAKNEKARDILMCLRHRPVLAPGGD